MPSRTKTASAPSLDQLLALARQDSESPQAVADAAEMSFARIDRALMIPIERVAPMKDNPRQSFRHLDELAESIGDRGLIQPLVVRRDPERPGYYMTVAGARRLMAANILRGSENADTRARVAMLPCIVADESDDQALASALAENLARDDLTRGEAMAAVLRLQEQYTWSAREIAKRTGRSFQDVAEMLKVAKDEELAALVRDEVIAPSAAGEIARLGVDARADVLSGVRSGQLRTVQDIRAANPNRSRARRTGLVKAQSAVSDVSEFRHMEDKTPTLSEFRHHTEDSTNKPGPGPSWSDSSSSRKRKPGDSDAETETLRGHFSAIRSILEPHPLLAWEPDIAETRAAIEAAAQKVSGQPWMDTPVSTQRARESAADITEFLTGWLAWLGEHVQDPQVASSIEEMVERLQRASK